MKHAHQKNREFIALMFAAIMSAILIGMLLTSSDNSLGVRVDGLNRELQEESRELAKSCAHDALLSIAENYSYIPKPSGDIMSVENSICAIDSVVYGNEDTTTHTKTATIQTHAEFHGTWAALTVHAIVASSTVAHNPPLPPIEIVSEQYI